MSFIYNPVFNLVVVSPLSYNLPYFVCIVTLSDTRQIYFSKMGTSKSLFHITVNTNHAIYNLMKLLSNIYHFFN
jgi:hypothetical protein